MRISVVIPTYRRLPDLRKCLEGLERQSRMPDEVLLIVRDTDRETMDYMESRLHGESALSLPVRLELIDIPGQVAALNRGLDRSKGDIIAITDDDTVPRTDWLERIEKHFASDDTVGGVGGRDWVYHDGRLSDGSRMTVGKVQWYGRVIGNHHLGSGVPREVDVLKGANMSYRRRAVESIRFEKRLKGAGAQVHNDMGFSYAVKKAGWKLIYDPHVAVDHFPAVRFDNDARTGFNAESVYNSSYNETFVLTKEMSPLRKAVFITWSLVLGTSTYPGVAQYLRLLVQRRTYATVRYYSVLRGRWDGFKAVSGKRVRG